MKPTPLFNDLNSRRGSEAPVRSTTAFPKTDYNYRPSVRDFSGRGHGDRQPSFREISREYFDGDARQTFAREAVLFAVIAMTAAVPVLEGARGLFQFVRAIGLL